MKIIGIIAGKGGVGKSVITASIASDLQKKGRKVGIIDADIYGPSIKQLVGTKLYPVTNPEGKIEPACSQGISYISLAFFQKDNSTTAVRAPIANDIILQFLNKINWDELDYLLVDFPPGTGDIPLTLIQQTSLSVVVVTTPGIISRIDVEKAILMCQQCDVPILGIIENMSYIALDKGHYSVFGGPDGEVLAKKFAISFLGKIPLSLQVGMTLGNGGTVAEITEKSFLSAVSAISEQLDRSYHENKGGDRTRQPRDIHIMDSDLCIIWKDGLEQKIPINQIQKNCPCQRCQDRASVSDIQVGATEVARIGNYALRIFFTSGCSMGLYPYPLLRKLGGMQHD